MGALARLDVDRQRIEILIQGSLRPKGVEEPRLEFGRDHSGDAAVYIFFPVLASREPTTANIKELTAFSSSLKHALYALGTDLLFYIRFEDEVEAG